MTRTLLSLAGPTAIVWLLTGAPADAQDAVVYVVEEVDLGDVLGTADIYIPVFIDTGPGHTLPHHGNPSANSLHGYGMGHTAWLDTQGNANAVPTDTAGDASVGATLGAAPYGNAAPVTRDW